MINLTITGYVGADAKLTDNGCVFNIANTEKGYVNKEGIQIEEKTTWVTVFYKNKNIAEHIKKGSYMIASANNVSTSIYNDKASLSINAYSVEFGGK